MFESNYSYYSRDYSSIRSAPVFVYYTKNKSNFTVLSMHTKKCHFSSEQMGLFIRQLDDLGIYSRQRSKQMADKKIKYN